MKEQMKVIAYTGQYGNEIVTTLQAQRLGLKTVYSCHKPGQRCEMYKTHRKQTHYFAYKNIADREGKTAPETLTHTLCKQVIAELAAQNIQTKLKFFNRYGSYSGRAEEEIVFDGGEVEQRIDVNGHTYIIDAFCRFTQPSAATSLFSLEQQWNGRIAFEIYHTAKLTAGSPKCRDLEAAGIPVIQIATGDPESILYLDEDAIAQMEEHDADRVIAAHLNKLRNIFRKSIGGVVYNNPKSAVFAEAEKLSAKLDAARRELETRRETEISKAEKMLQLDKELIIEKQNHFKIVKAYNELSLKLADISDKNNRLKDQIERITNENSRLHAKVEFSEKLFTPIFCLAVIDYPVHIVV